VSSDGKIIREGKVETDPDAIGTYLSANGIRDGRIGLEAGPLCQWLYAGLARAGFPIFCIETRHAQAVLNKTDRNDARGIAQMMRVGLFKPVHVKTLASLEVRLLLGGRRVLQTTMIDIENSIRGLLRNFGLKVGLVTRAGYEARIRDLVEGNANLEAVVEPMLAVRRTIREQYVTLHKRMMLLAREDRVCRLLMSAPGVGPLVALSYRASIDEPARFQNSRAVGAHVGLAPRTHQSGELDKRGRISKTGDVTVRTALFEAAGVLMRSTSKSSPLKSRGLQIAKRRGMARAITAVARKLAVVLHRMWIDGTPFRWSAMTN
jgi:transposase